MTIAQKILDRCYSILAKMGFQAQVLNAGQAVFQIEIRTQFLQDPTKLARHQFAVNEKNPTMTTVFPELNEIFN